MTVVTCKAWQAGFNPGRKLAELRGERPSPKGRATWRHFRELWVPKWSEAFRKSITDLTGQDTFTYRIAVTRLVGEGDPAEWTDPTITKNLPGCPVGFLVREDMWKKMVEELTKTPASSEMGRLVQLLRAAGLTATRPLAPPSAPARSKKTRLRTTQKHLRLARDAQFARVRYRFGRCRIGLAQTCITC